MGMALSIAGVLLIILGSASELEFGWRSMAGDLICIAAAAVWGLSTNLQKPLLERYSSMQLSFLMVTVGALGLSIISLPTALSVSWSTIHWSYYAAAVGSGALSIGAGSILWSRGIKRLGPGRTANFNNLVPVFAVILSTLTLHEQLLAVQVIGIGVTIVGVWIARRQ